MIEEINSTKYKIKFVVGYSRQVPKPMGDLKRKGNKELHR